VTVAGYLVEHVPEQAAGPHRGRPGKMVGTRELVIPSLPYLIAHTVRDDVEFVV
jgi:hypothetical protein